MSKKYNRVILGEKSKYAEECLQGGFIGVDFGVKEDLSNYLTYDVLSTFNKILIPKIQSIFPDKSKASAALGGGSIYTVCSKLASGDIVISPYGDGSYLIGEISSDYFYEDNQILPHRRQVKWLNTRIQREDMSEDLKNSTGSIGTTCDITKYEVELDSLIAGQKLNPIISLDETIESPTEFAMESHLEDFMVKNWSSIELSNEYDIYEEEGELIGKQYETDTRGRIDILLQSKDRKTIAVLELKKGRTSDVVVGQTQRYMGYIKEVVAEEGQEVKGIIVALEEDIKLKRALSVTENINFYKYQVTFKLEKVL